MSSSNNNKFSPSFNQKKFFYFNDQGENIGNSEGENPDPCLYQTAYYVLINEEIMIKNNDSIAIIEGDIAAYSKELINTPIMHMDKILSLNKIIGALKGCLDNKKAPTLKSA